MKKLLMVLLIAFVLIGCSRQSGHNSTNDMNMNTPDGEVGINDDMEAPSFGQGVVEESTDTKKIITTINYEMESKSFDDDLDRLNETVSRLGGRVISLDIGGRQADERYNSTRYVNVIYQVPYDKLDEFNESFDEIAIVSQQMKSDDVSKKYRDNRLRIESLETQHARLLELISDAETLEALVVLESRLSELELEINQLTGANLEIEDLSDHVTVSIHMREIDESGRLSTDISFGSRIGEAFNDMIEGTIKGIESLIIGVVRYLPVVLIIGVVATAGVLTLRGATRKKRPTLNIKKEEKSEE